MIHYYYVLDEIFKEAGIMDYDENYFKASANKKALLKDVPLIGHVIRISDNDGMYIVGCCMLEDSKSICDYVEKNYLGA